MRQFSQSRDDAALVERTQRLSIAAKDAIAWLHDNAGVVGNRLQALEHSCRRHAVEARRLAVAAGRPMSVGVFGPSQSGKSFLVGGLITPPGGLARVVFGAGSSARQLDFLEEVNPQGGKETTGVVTRFSIRSHPAQPGHEVVLRLLREIDVVKILANTFVHDLGREADAVIDPTGEWLAALEHAFARALPEEPVDTLSLEDIFELRAYLGHKLKLHPLAERAGTLVGRYWTLAERALPHLSAADRARLLAPLWGGLPELTDLYDELKRALDQLRLPSGEAPDQVCVPLAAISDRSRSMVHVDSLLGLDGAGRAAAATVSVAVPGGAVTELPQAVVTALTAELRLTLAQAAWPLFVHTDLLDFPGARSREDSTPTALLRQPSKGAGRAQCFLRGKVAVLFDTYTADLDLNAMLLCLGPENLEVSSLRGLVEDWISETHGPTPEARRGRRTSLLLCLTKADTLFDVKAGATPAATIANRLKNNLGSFSGWSKSWTPGQAFDNVFLIRNPKGLQREDVFFYARPEGTSSGTLPVETGLRPDKAAFIEERRAAFLDNPAVGVHVAAAAAKWEAMLALNDGGIGHLATALAPVCDPVLKRDQIAPRAAALGAELVSELGTFHVSGDLQERIEARLAAINEVVLVFKGRPMLLGPFLAQLHAEPGMLGRRFLEITRQYGGNEHAPAWDDERDHAGITIELDGDEVVPARAMPLRFGDALVAAWLDGLERRAGDAELARAFALTCEQFHTVVAELAVAARRLRLAEKVEAYVRETSAYAQAAADVVHRVDMGSAVIINRLVNRLGTDLEPLDRTDVPRQATMPELAPGDLPPLPADLRAMAPERGRWAGFWLSGLRFLTRENAGWGQGGRVDITQNQRLGQLLERLRG